MGSEVPISLVNTPYAAPRDNYYEFNVATAEEGIIGAVPTVFATRTSYIYIYIYIYI